MAVEAESEEGAGILKPLKGVPLSDPRHLLGHLLQVLPPSSSTMAGDQVLSRWPQEDTYQPMRVSLGSVMGGGQVPAFPKVTAQREAGRETSSECWGVSRPREHPSRIL